MDTDRALALRFADVVGLVGAWCHQNGAVTPVIRTPPRSDTNRALTRTNNTVTVAVRITGRPEQDWIRDIVAGVCAASDAPHDLHMRNGLTRYLIDTLDLDWTEPDDGPDPDQIPELGDGTSGSIQS